ncbi:MAG: glycosyl transferase, partial [Xanthobacteraceae bacterium]
LMLLMLATFLAWMKCGRDLVPVGSVLSIVSYIAGKLRLYFIGLFRKKDAQWIKTDRAKSE